MSRSLTGSMAAEIAAKQLAPVFLCELDFLGGFVRMWNGIGTLSWNGYDWLGGGNLMAISQVEETRAVEATSMTFTLSGVDPALVSLAYGDFSQGRAAKVWLGAIASASGLIVSEPIAVYQGRMDTIGDTDDGTTAEISVSSESNLADLKRVRARYLTDQDQQRLFAADRSLRYLPNLQDRPVYWGVREGSPQLPSAL